MGNTLNVDKNVQNVLECKNITIYKMMQNLRNKLVRDSEILQKDLKQRDGEGRNPLMNAILQGKIALAIHYINEGSCLNSQDIYGDTPLIMATK